MPGGLKREAARGGRSAPPGQGNETTLRHLLDAKRYVVGGWCAIPSAFSAEVMGRAGFDWVCIDTQHGLAGHAETIAMIQALDVTRTPPVVRVTWNDPGLIMRALDAGAAGVIVPMVNTAEEARRAAGACLYAPDGYRSWGPARAALGRPDFNPATANRDLFCAVMVETVDALSNLDQIASVPGIDAIYVGPSDLAVSLGVDPTLDPVDPRHVAAIQQIRRVCGEHDMITGIHCGSPATAKRWIAEGFRMVSVRNDAYFIQQMAGDVVSALRESGPTAES
jgi:4-hydroxy-2-oxoheptanedioate aldolase